MSPRVTGSVGRGNPADAPAASPAAIVTVQFDLAESIRCRGYRVPDDDALACVVKTFRNWLWYEVEEHWHDIVEASGVVLLGADGGEA